MLFILSFTLFVNFIQNKNVRECKASIESIVDACLSILTAYTANNSHTVYFNTYMLDDASAIVAVVVVVIVSFVFVGFLYGVDFILALDERNNKRLWFYMLCNKKRKTVKRLIA